MKKKLLSWIGFALIVYLVVFGIGLITHNLIKPIEQIHKVEGTIQCYAPTYAYSGESPYIAAICSTENNSISLVRVNSSGVFKENHIGDWISFLLLITGGGYSVSVVVRKLLPIYIPRL